MSKIYKISENHNLNEIKSYNHLTYFLSYIFHLLQFLPPQCFLGNRTDFQKDYHKLTAVEKVLKTKKNSLRVEKYIIVCIFTEVFLFLWLLLTDLKCFIIPIIAGLRIVDIFQKAMNVILFDQIRNEKPMYMASYVRTTLLTLVNYFELILCFGIIYLYFHTSLCGYKDAFDTIYFSVVTQLTIGYGDIKPIGPLKAVAAVQGVLGLLFSIFILGRFFTSRPEIISIFGNKNRSKINYRRHWISQQYRRSQRFKKRL